jgi:hypothetical protein
LAAIRPWPDGLREEELPGIFDASGCGLVIAEPGIVGRLLRLVPTVRLIYSGRLATRQEKGTSAFPGAISILTFGYLLLVPWWSEGLWRDQNFVRSAHLWLRTGVLIQLPVQSRQDSLQVDNEIWCWLW